MRRKLNLIFDIDGSKLIDENKNSYSILRATIHRLLFPRNNVLSRMIISNNYQSEIRNLKPVDTTFNHVVINLRNNSKIVAKFSMIRG